MWDELGFMGTVVFWEWDKLRGGKRLFLFLLLFELGWTGFEREWIGLYGGLSRNIRGSGLFSVLGWGKCRSGCIIGVVLFVRQGPIVYYLKM